MVATLLIFGLLPHWSSWRLQRIRLQRGRQAVERELARRGETLVGIKPMACSALPSTTGLSASAIFHIVARRPDGGDRTYQWAHEPRTFPGQTGGLKRCAHGIWIALA